MRSKDIRAAAVVVLAGLILAACAAGGNAKYKTVSVSYDYTGKDQSSRAWRAFMEALDQCHISGYEDAQMTGLPQHECKRGSPDNCSLYHATAQYDCFGLGYQTSS
jgi:hypothetical protein